MKRRAYQREALRAFKTRGTYALLWERQAGKSTTLADLALFDMMRNPGRTCIYASASLLLAREIILKETERVDISVRDLIAKESAVLLASATEFSGQAKAAGLLFQTADAEKGKILTGLSLDDFSELFESQRLEFRVYHDRNIYSRTQVIAPNVATARGWSGTVFLDEIGFIRDFLQLWIAIEPIISTKQDFKLVMSTTPPQDDTHYCYELLAAPTGLEFKTNAAGNWYESELGIPVHRADCLDTYEAGKRIFDVKTRIEITPEQAFQRAINKDGYRVNHQLKWLLGGSAAIDLLRLKTAQERGVGECAHFAIDSDADMAPAMAWLERRIHPTAKIGVGYDVATTTKDKSNPSCLGVIEQLAPDYIYLTWKTKDGAIAWERIHRVLDVIEKRPGGRARALAQDATNEKYFAEDTRKEFRRRLPVLLVVSSESCDKPGLETPTNWKEFLGDQYVGLFDDNRMTCPPEIYFRADHRLVRKDRGRFVCEPDADGRHGDTFDGGKLGVHALNSRGDAVAIASAMGQHQTIGL
jgi:hypothetical protein